MVEFGDEISTFVFTFQVITRKSGGTIFYLWCCLCVDGGTNGWSLGSPEIIYIR